MHAFCRGKLARAACRALVTCVIAAGLLGGGAAAAPPTAYRCGKGGKPAPRDEACACPAGAVPARDRDGVAVCAPKRARSRAPVAEATLTTTAATMQRLGAYVALDDAGTRAIVGAMVGGAVVFVHGPTGWAEEAVLARGGEVALSGDGQRAFVSEAVFVRDASGWRVEQALAASIGGRLDRAGARASDHDGAGEDRLVRPRRAVAREHRDLGLTLALRADPRPARTRRRRTARSTCSSAMGRRGRGRRC